MILRNDYLTLWKVAVSVGWIQLYPGVCGNSEHHLYLSFSLFNILYTYILMYFYLKLYTGALESSTYSYISLRIVL